MPGNVLCFDVKEDERNEGLLDRYPVWYCAIWYIMFSKSDLTWSMMERVHSHNKSGYSNNKTKDT